ncbi:MAG: hypothetical protein M1482_01980 [Chloroflexi bacterium]|nr:hypothetical protein [Chloroflexota bacterium]
MANIPPELQTRLTQNASASIKVIVRFNGDAGACAAAAQAHGVVVRYTFSLTSTLAIEGTGAAVLALANESWVDSVEEDRTVHTM